MNRTFLLLLVSGFVFIYSTIFGSFYGFKLLWVNLIMAIVAIPWIILYFKPEWFNMIEKRDFLEEILEDIQDAKNSKEKKIIIQTDNYELVSKLQALGYNVIKVSTPSDTNCYKVTWK